MTIAFVSHRCAIIAALLSSMLIYSAGAGAFELRCLNTGGKAAVEACRQALDAGSNSAAVYLALAKALSDLGRQRQALAVIKVGQQRFPASPELAGLKGIVRSHIAGHAHIQSQSSDSGRSPAIAAKLKLLAIRCSKKTGREALLACNSYLQRQPRAIPALQRRAALLLELGELTEAQASFRKLSQLRGDDRYRSVLAEIERRLSTQSDGPTIAGVAAPPSPEVPSLPGYDAGNVERIQALLNTLGLEVGSEDGIAGRRTRDQLSRFYRLSEQPQRQQLSAETIDDLELAVKKQQVAADRVEQARRLQQQGDVLSALNGAREALALVPWSASLRELVVQLEQQYQQAGQQQVQQVQQVQQEQLHRQEAEQQLALQLNKQQLNKQQQDQPSQQPQPEPDYQALMIQARKLRAAVATDQQRLLAELAELRAAAQTFATGAAD